VAIPTNSTIHPTDLNEETGTLLCLHCSPQPAELVNAAVLGDTAALMSRSTVSEPIELPA